MSKLRILHLEDSPSDALFVELALKDNGFDPDMVRVQNEAQFTAALDKHRPELILVDNGVPGFDGAEALKLARRACPEIPFIFVSGSTEEETVMERLNAGATDYVSKDHLWQLTTALRRALAPHPRQPEPPARIDVSRPGGHVQAMKRLVAAVQELSLARNLDAVMAVVRRAARELTGADGATFVLREGDKCHYADEDAIEPLWKGQRFPISACVSGWAMLNRRPAVIPDIFSDPRVPADAYRPTFVKSLVMVPIRTESPIGAIGNYWARPHEATPEEVELLQTLANTTSVALENVQLYRELEQRVQDRTAQLEQANRELETFSYSVSHDLRAPLRSINGFIGLLAEECGPALNEQAWTYISRARSQTARMAMLIDDLLRLAKISRTELKHQSVDLSAMAYALSEHLRSQQPGQKSEWRLQNGLRATGDARLIQVALENLLSNAWKYSSKTEKSVIEFGAMPDADGFQRFFVRDNGAGFDMKFAAKLFTPFQRLHGDEEFSGTGVGLATVQRILERHGGKIWAEATVGQGATFFFSLPRPTAPSPA